MKKTMTINLAGMVFHIEEDGYQLLKNYFDDLRRIFSKQEGMEEMMADIELRFAELFHERLSEFKEVVTMQDVQETIDIMGSPSQYDDEYEEGNEQKQFSSTTDSQKERRLFRDTDDAIIGGVASGMGHYFGIDPVIVRILWVILFFLGGSGFLVYLLAWAIIPEAKTTSQKLQMHGQTPNLDNIKTYVDKATDEAKKGFDRAKRKVEDTYYKNQDSFRKTTSVFRRIIGGLILIVGILSLAGIGIAFFLKYSQITINNAVISTDLNSIVSLFFINEKLSFWLIFMVAAIPILFLIVWGAKLLFNQKLKVKALNWSLFLIWVAAIVGLVIVSFNAGLDFKEKYTVEEYGYIYEDYSELSLYLFEDDIEITNSIDYDFDNYISLTDDLVKLGYVNIEVFPTKDSIFYYKIEKSSNGGTLKSSKENAEGIQFDLDVDGNKIDLGTRFSFQKSMRFRDQKVGIKIYVPHGKRLVLNGNLKEYPLKVQTVNKFVKRDLKQTSVWESTERGMELVE